MNNSIFGKGREKILEYFYNNKERESYFSEILRATGLTQNTTLKHLALLEDNHIIIKEKKIANTFFRLSPDNPQVFSLLSYLDFKRYNSLESGKKRAIDSALSRAGLWQTKNKDEKVDVVANEKSGGIPIIALVFFFQAQPGIIFVRSDQKPDIITKANSDDDISMKGISYSYSFSYFKDQLSKRSPNDIKRAAKDAIVLHGHDIFYDLILR